MDRKVVINLLLVISSVAMVTAEDSCEFILTPIGCYKDSEDYRSTAKDLLLSGRDESVDVYDDQFKIDWHNWPKFLNKFTCECARRVLARKEKYIGVQYYGECWRVSPGPRFNKDSFIQDVKDFKQCLNGEYKPCTDFNHGKCMGGPLHNFIYRVKKKPSSPDNVDGNYSEWSSWSACSRSCGGGTKARERTCTNPSPVGNGKDCSGLGPSEEASPCNRDSCPEPSRDGGWSQWSHWSTCTATCGGGGRKRERSCTNPTPQGAGKPCSGSSVETETCNNIPCPVPCDKSLDIALILDSSGSIRKKNFEKMKKFIAHFTKHFKVSPAGTHIAVITYHLTARVQFSFADAKFHDPVRVRRRIMRIKYDEGWTRTDRALELADTKLFTSAWGDRVDKKNVAIVFTDGDTNPGSKPYPSVLLGLLKKKVTLIAVGIGDGIDKIELLEIADGKKENVVEVKSFDVLNEILNRIIKDSCDGSSPPGPERACGTSDETILEVKSPQVKATSYKRRYKPKCGNMWHQCFQGAWSPKKNNKDQYLQFDFNKPVKITHIDTQGRRRGKQWVSKYWVSYSTSVDGFFHTYYDEKGHQKSLLWLLDGYFSFPFVSPEVWRVNQLHVVQCEKIVVFPELSSHQELSLPFYAVLSRFETVGKRKESKAVQKKGKIFKANSDSDTKVTADLGAMPIFARVIRIHPLTWKGFIALRVGFRGCISGFVPPVVPECLSAMGMQNGKIKNNQIKASSWSGYYRPYNARLWKQANSAKRHGCWFAKKEDTNQWLQVDFKKEVQLKTLAIHGSPDWKSWVKKIRFSYSQDGIFWEDYRSAHGMQIFLANTNAYTIKYLGLKPKILARKVRVHAVEWHKWIPMRLEFYGCDALVSPPGKPTCMKALGAKNQVFTSSSDYDSKYSAPHARLGRGRNFWRPKTDAGSWLKIELSQTTKITAIAIKGGNRNYWVQSYKLEYSVGGNKFEWYDNERILYGNTCAGKCVHKHLLTPHIITRAIKFHPVTWNKKIGLRLKLYGCTDGVPQLPSDKCLKPLGLSDGTIKDSQMFASSWRSNKLLPKYGRLHGKLKRGRGGAWVAKWKRHQFLGVRFKQTVKVTRVCTQGHHHGNQWVSRYRIEYSMDGGKFKRTKEYQGNRDGRSVVCHTFDRPITARVVRIHPTRYNRNVALRMELDGCVVDVKPPSTCDRPYGLETRYRKVQLKGSSSWWGRNYNPDYARLHFFALASHGHCRGGWRPRSNRKAWLQVAFGRTLKVTGIATQGSGCRNAWVKFYTLKYVMRRRGKKTWCSYRERRSTKLFKGNRNRYSVVRNDFAVPIRTCALRLYPKGYKSYIALRVEVYGCIA